MVPRIVAHDCADTSLDRARNSPCSRVSQDSNHVLQASVAAAIYWGYMGMASLYVMCDCDTINACSGAR